MKARPSWVIHPVPNEAWNFPVWLVVTVPVPITVWALDIIASNFFKFPVLTSLLTCLCWSVSADYSRENFCRSLRFSPCISSFWYFVPWTVVALFSLDSQLHVNSGSLLGSASLPTPDARAWKLKAKWVNCRAHLFCLPSLRDHCPSLLDARCLENYCFI